MCDFFMEMAMVEFITRHFISFHHVAAIGVIYKLILYRSCYLYKNNSTQGSNVKRKMTFNQAGKAGNGSKRLWGWTGEDIEKQPQDVLAVGIDIEFIVSGRWI